MVHEQCDSRVSSAVCAAKRAEPAGTTRKLYHNQKKNICDANTASPCVTWLQNVIRVIDETYVCVLQHPTL